MEYRVVYNTLIEGVFRAKDEVIVFEKGTDEGYIHRLVALKVIAPSEANQVELQKQGEPEAEPEKAQEPKQNNPKSSKKNNKEQ